MNNEFNLSYKEVNQLYIYFSQRKKQNNLKRKIHYILCILLYHNCIIICPNFRRMVFKINYNEIEFRPYFCCYVNNLERQTFINVFIIKLLLTNRNLTKKQIKMCIRMYIFDIIRRENKKKKLNFQIQYLKKFSYLKFSEEFNKLNLSKKNRNYLKMIHNLTKKLKKNELILQLQDKFLNKNFIGKSLKNVEKKSEEFWKKIIESFYIKPLFHNIIDGKLKQRQILDNPQWNINHQRFLLDLRSFFLKKYFSSRIDQKTTKIIRILLEPRNFVETQSIANFGGFSNINKKNLNLNEKNITLKHINEKHGGNYKRLLIRCRKLTLVDPQKILPFILMFKNNDNLSINVILIIREICILNSLKIIISKHGINTGIVLRILILKGMLPMEKISIISLIGKKKINCCLFKLLREKWIQNQEFPESVEERNTIKSIFGWFISWNLMKKEIVNSLRITFFKLTNRRIHYEKELGMLKKENIKMKSSQLEKTKELREKKIFFFLYLIDFQILRIYQEVALFRYF